MISAGVLLRPDTGELHKIHKAGRWSVRPYYLPKLKLKLEL